MLKSFKSSIFLIGGSVTFLVSGCATQPEDIKAAYVSPLQYESYSCRQIGMEMERVSRRVSELHGNLDQKADGDAAQMGIGLVLFWPALFFLEGGDGSGAQEYARLKGEKEALEKTSIQKKCGLQFDNAKDRARSAERLDKGSAQERPRDDAGLKAGDDSGRKSRHKVRRYWEVKIDTVQKDGIHKDCEFSVESAGRDPSAVSDCEERKDKIASYTRDMERELGRLQ